MFFNIDRIAVRVSNPEYSAYFREKHKISFDVFFLSIKMYSILHKYHDHELFVNFVKELSNSTTIKELTATAVDGIELFDKQNLNTFNQDYIYIRFP